MITKKFSKSYDEVLIQAYLFQSELVADQAAFTANSPLFASPFADDFLDDIEAADAIPTNEDDLNFQTFHSQAVEDKMVLAREHYQKLIYYVGLAFPDSDTILKLFGNNQYERARYTPLKMSNLLQNSYDMANSTTYKASLIATGFLQTDITLLNTLDADLTAKIKVQQDFIKHSFKRSEDRMIAFNKVWDTMVKISAASKLIFKDSPAKIEFYLLYPEGPGPGTLTAPEDLSFYFPGTLFSWSPVENATSYILQASTDGVDFFEIFSGAETEFVYVPVQTGWMWFRCKAHNAGGSSEFSNPVLKQGYYPGPTLPAPSNLAVELVSGTTDSIQLSFGEVPSANVYKIYRSTTNIGDVAGSFVYAGQSNTNSFIETIAAAGHRFYYRCTAENPHQASGNSSQVWIDIA